jgi:hypothetical protein
MLYSIYSAHSNPKLELFLSLRTPVWVVKPTAGTPSGNGIIKKTHAFVKENYGNFSLENNKNKCYTETGFIPVTKGFIRYEKADC